MAGSLAGGQLSISLEDHLVDTLRPLHPRLPDHLAQELAPYLSTSPPPAMPYTLLFSISRWTRSDPGLEALHTQTPSLDPQSYSMVSLLAGATTSPERFFGSYTPPKDPAEVQAGKNRERKAITALLNALLSIVGSAFATWWAAEKLGWRNEWVCIRFPVQSIHLMYSVVFKRVLSGLFVAILVAVSEGVLFLLWQSRAEASKRKRRLRAADHRKLDTEKEDLTHTETDNVVSSSTTTEHHISELRQRK